MYKNPSKGKLKNVGREIQKSQHFHTENTGTFRKKVTLFSKNNSGLSDFLKRKIA